MYHYISIWPQNIHMKKPAVIHLDAYLGFYNAKEINIYKNSKAIFVFFSRTVVFVKLSHHAQI